MPFGLISSIHCHHVQVHVDHSHVHCIGPVIVFFYFIKDVSTTYPMTRPNSRRFYYLGSEKNIQNLIRTRKNTKKVSEYILLTSTSIVIPSSLSSRLIFLVFDLVPNVGVLRVLASSFSICSLASIPFLTEDKGLGFLLELVW